MRRALTTAISVARARVGVLAATAAALLPACGPPALVLPPPPQDLTALAHAYASPTGTVDTAQLQQVVTGAEAQFNSSDLQWLPTLVSNTLVSMRERFDASSFPFDPTVTHQNNRPGLQALITAQHTCTGWTDTPGPPDPAANGNLDLTAIIDDSQLRRDLSGNGTNCQERLQDFLNVTSVNVFFSGSLGVLLRGPLPANAKQTTALVLASGQIGTDTQVANGSFDFAIDGPAVAFRYPVSDGYVIVSIGTQSVSVRGSNGTFACDLTGVNCSAS